MRITTKTPLLWLAGLLFGVVPATAGESADPTARELQTIIERALQDEYRAERIYERVLQDHGEARPFSNVVHAERRHSTSLEGLLTKRGWALSGKPEGSVAEVPGFPSLDAACRAAVTAEEANVALYDELLTRQLPEDLERVFTHNRIASLERHLPAFQRCASRRGTGRQQ